MSETPKNSFKKLIAIRFLYTLATQIQAVILGWQMYVLTHNPLYLGFIGLAEAIPALGFALFAGYIVDRSNPSMILRSMMGLGLLSGLIILFSHVSMIHFTVTQQIGALFISSILTGTARAFLHPAIFVIMPRIVPRNETSQASAWMTSSFLTASISGPAIGGILFGWAGIGVASGVLCSLILLALITTFLLKIPHITRAKESLEKTLRKELFLGAAFVFKHPILLPALSLDMLSVLFGGVTALLPIYAAEILHIGPKGLGILRASPAIGGALITLILTRIHIKKNAGIWLLSAVTGFGCCILVFALSKNLILSFIALTLSGAFDGVSAVIRSTAVQLCSREDMRGRISAINLIFISSSNELGAFESGVAAKLLGTCPAAVFGGIACLATVAIVAWLCPRLRTLDLGVLEAHPEKFT
jgi:MFS family permease